jgi:hypothetical protein
MTVDEGFGERVAACHDPALAMRFDGGLMNATATGLLRPWISQ